MTLTVAVFSYNRGAYLRHCLESLSRNIPWAQVMVFDDASTDPETVAILRNLTVPVITTDTAQKARLGGLYANMQRALETVQTDWIFFLQEDMQIVRPVDEDETAVLTALFAEVPTRAFICPVFVKGIRARQHRNRLHAHSSLRAYVGTADAKGAFASAYSDVSIGHVGRLRAAGWTFQPTERLNKAQAQRLFADMPYLADPFAFYCPEVPVFRQRSQSLAARLAARITGPDVKALKEYTADQATQFRNRPLTDWPVAEDHLRPVDPRVRIPFVYKDVKVRWWLAALHKIEQALRR